MELIIGSVVIPLQGRVQLRQSYEVLGGASLLRLADGSARKQTRWQKLRTTIAGTGWLPLGLDLLDYSQALTVDCISPRSVLTESTSVALPGVLRPDVAPTVLARIAEQEWVGAESSESGGTVTITPVTGAIQYQVRWWPRLTCFFEPPRDALDVSPAEWDWELVGEES